MGRVSWALLHEVEPCAVLTVVPVSRTDCQEWATTNFLEKKKKLVVTVGERLNLKTDKGTKIKGRKSFLFLFVCCCFFFFTWPWVAEDWMTAPGQMSVLAGWTKHGSVLFFLTFAVRFAVKCAAAPALVSAVAVQFTLPLQHSSFCSYAHSSVCCQLEYGLQQDLQFGRLSYLQFYLQLQFCLQWQCSLECSHASDTVCDVICSSDSSAICEIPSRKIWSASICLLLWACALGCFLSAN